MNIIFQVVLGMFIFYIIAGVLKYFSQSNKFNRQCRKVEKMLEKNKNK